MKFRKTTGLEKLLTSVLNIILLLVILVSIYFFMDLNFFETRIIFVGLFLVYDLVFLGFEGKRDIGMRVMGTYWEKDYSFSRMVVHSVFYTLSFSTLLFYVFFPFDLFLINMLLIQLPTILLNGTTFHGWLSGGVVTVKKI